MKAFLTSFILLLASMVTVSGQDSVHIKTKALFFGGGMISYNGDLGAGFSTPSLMGCIGLKLNTQKKLNGNFNLSFGQFSGQELDYEFTDDPTTTPNSYFKTTFFSLHYDVQFNIIHRPKLKVYISQGFGLIRFNVKNEFGISFNDQPNTRALGEEYSNISIMLPTQLGCQYTLPNNFGLGLQAGFYNVMTDYVDNISQWGNNSGNDNLFGIKILVSVPVSF